MPSCTSCGSSNIETDHARGSAVCTNCGMVLEDNIIMAEVSFMENDKGGSGVVGQFVNADGGKMFSLGSSSYHHGFGRDSKAVTLQNGKRSISSLAASLALNSSHVEAAYSYFKLAVEHKFIQGRRTESVVAACLYIECRKQQTSHMLLDFSDILQTNVYVLGAVYLKLCQKLRVRLPVVDPSLYIVRFSHRLEFNEKTHEVSMTAMRLVQRMKRDWIQVGRRPAGICGAALLIAARLHGFSRTQGEIIEVVRICNATLRRRLEEFSDTPSSELTPQEFQEIDLEEEADPPSYQSARRKKAVEELEKLAESTDFRALEDPDDPSAAGPDATAAGASAVPGAARVAAAGTAHSQDLEGDLATLSDVDDDEINDAIMGEEEIKEKERVWNEMNKDFLEQQAAKEEQMVKDKEAGVVKREPKKRKRRPLRPSEPAANAEEALQQMLAQKKVSKKLNYAVLEGLTMPSGLSSNSNMVTLTLGTGAAGENVVPESEVLYEGEGEGAQGVVGADFAAEEGGEEDGYGDYYDGGGDEDFG
eukprot:m.178698 g.178698  ORF g.178698 m.178698 type:complete len:533 (+) comp15360_c0_seq38:1038-2636(+)